MKRPQRTLIAPSYWQLVAVITVLSFGANAVAAAANLNVNPADLPKADTSWANSAKVLKEAAGFPTETPASAPADTPAVSTREKTGGRLKNGESQQKPNEEGRTLCQGLKDKKADEKKANDWAVELVKISRAHTRNLTFNDLQKPRQAFLDAIVRSLSNFTYIPGQNKYVLKEERGATPGVCDRVRDLDQEAAALFKHTEATGDSDGCGNYRATYVEIQKLKAKNKEVGLHINRILNGAKNGDNQQLGLESHFQNDMKSDAAQIDNAVTKSGAAGARLQADLMDEFTRAWGFRLIKGSTKPLKPALNDSDGFFTVILNMTRNELAARKKLDDSFDKYLKSMTSYQRCSGTETNVEKVRSRFRDPKSDVSGSVKPEGPSSGVDSQFQDGTTKTDEEKIAELKERCETLGGDSAAQDKCYSELSSATDRVRSRQKQIESYKERLSGSSSLPYNRQPPPASSPDGPEQPLRKGTFTNTDSASSFLSENAGLLVGGTLLVGGGAGLYFWDKYEKDKRQQEWESYWANVQAANGTSTSTSTSTGTNRTLLVKSGIGAVAVAGVNLPSLQVAIVDGSGNTLTGQDVDITISCTTPIPCYLTGTTTVRSVNGIATFSDVRFTQAVSGVRIRFAAPWGGIDQSNSFDVNPLAGGTNTATSTNTLTGTLTTTVTDTGTTTNTATSTGTSTRE